MKKSNSVILSICISFFLSCDNNQGTTVTTDVTEPTTVEIPQVDSSAVPTPPSSEPEIIHESVFPMGKYKTMAAIMRNAFTTWSSKEEVLAVQGRPNQIQKIDESEIWVYGNCEVTFKENFVDRVDNEEDCLKYSNGFLFSPDPIEKEFATYLLRRAIKKSADRKTFGN